MVYASSGIAISSNVTRHALTGLSVLIVARIILAVDSSVNIACSIEFATTMQLTWEEKYVCGRMYRLPIVTTQYVPGLSIIPPLWLSLPHYP
jgi:hypothetical protein